MKLYHGTSADRVEAILRQGIRPRWDSESTFPEHPSSPEHVYLSDCYAPYFAHCAVSVNAGRKGRLGKAGSRLALIEVDVPVGRLLPDEDFLEQATRGTQNQPAGDMGERTEWFRDRLGVYQHLWRESLLHLGTVCHLETIGVDRITRIVEFNPETNLLYASTCADPSISLLNHSVLARKYELLTKWFFEPISEWEALQIAGLGHLVNVHENQRASVEGVFGEHMANARHAARVRHGLKEISNV